MPEPSAAQRRFLKKRQQKMRTVTLVRILIFTLYESLGFSYFYTYWFRAKNVV